VTEIHPISLAIDSTGKFLYVDGGDFVNSVPGYSITSDGGLSPLPGSPLAVAPQGTSVTFLTLTSK
jgi:hypothetical protein